MGFITNPDGTSGWKCECGAVNHYSCICETSEQSDRVARYHPTASAVRHARALLEAEPRADLAAIPMIQPGKTYGIWTVGQEVETVPGVVFIGVNSFEVVDGAEVPSFAWARDAAASVARAALAGRPGTTAYAVVRREGFVPVFEDILTGKAINAELLAEAIGTLERLGCQSEFCDGPTLEPVAMKTCYACATLAKLRDAAGRKVGK